MKPIDVGVVGGAGHVGLPLSIVLASKGHQVLIYDSNPTALKRISSGVMPFMEQDAGPVLKKVLAAGRLRCSDNPAGLAGVSTVIVTIGTPIDEFLNPSIKPLMQCVDRLLPWLSDDQLLILRSTVYPGTTAKLAQYLDASGRRLHVAYCPERLVQGYAMKELQTLPQIISGVTPEAERRAAAFFTLLTSTVVPLAPMEAEFAKLFCNAYRYIQFAVTNQFYMMATSAGQDYHRILQGMKQDYSRMRDVPTAGFSAGPCLFKDTMQLTAFYDNEFTLGYTAMLVNEGVPLYLVQQLAKTYDVSRLTIGLLGMAFKADIDDPRASLSYKLKKVLTYRAKRVLATDPYVNDPQLLPVDEVIADSDVLILCIPHSVYRELDLRGKPVLDIWNFFGAATPARTPSAAPVAATV